MSTWTTTMHVEYGLTRGQSLVAVRLRAARGTGLSLHSHPDHQLMLAARGAVTARIGDEAWAVQPGQAIWIPADAEHDLTATSDVDLLCLYLDPEQCGPLAAVADRAHVFTAGGLLRELVVALARPDLADDQACRLRAVLLDLLAVPGTVKTSLPVPTHREARLVARALLSDPADSRQLAQWAADVFVSERTLQRAFVAETGLSFAAWRTLVRLEAAVPLLARGDSISAVAPTVGYTSTNGFAAAYRRHFGSTPAVHAPPLSA